MWHLYILEEVCSRFIRRTNNLGAASVRRC